MRYSKFTKENALDRAETCSAGEHAFGAPASVQRQFGRASSPRFGGSAALKSDERGVAVVEYALICALIVVAIVASVGRLGGGVNQTWSNVDHQVNDATTYTTS